jgi:hypothetical protein
MFSKVQQSSAKFSKVQQSSAKSKMFSKVQQNVQQNVQQSLARECSAKVPRMLIVVNNLLSFPFILIIIIIIDNLIINNLILSSIPLQLEAQNGRTKRRRPVLLLVLSCLINADSS